MSSEIVSREGELASIHAFIGEKRGGPAGLVLEGEAGIGKSTLWLAGVEHARARGLRILASRPAEAERGLAHVGLGDLFDDVLDDVLPALSPPRRRALEIALLREEATRGPVDQRALAVAVRGALQLLSEPRPLVIAVDDVQWLDQSSSSALAFALRRLGSSQVFLLLARRLGDGAQPSEIEQALGTERVQRLPVGPLSVGALHRFLRNRLGRSFGRQTLLRIHERSGGNPFFALELAGILDTDVDPLRPLPVPETLEELVRARISALPASTREALAFASALGAPSVYPPAPVVGHLPGPRREAAERSRTHRRNRRRPAPPRPSPGAVDGNARRRRRRSPRRRREAGSRSWRVGTCGRACRAGAPADAAGRTRGAASTGPRRSSCAS
ncbi:MAG: hypothetical protein E6G19_06060 [Actinobacteria bacterium]|nr:MAG: hypothetical protein E6G19_06060 [Actinomycetota bacterium]